MIDLRCLHPYDWHTIERSVTRTGRVLFVNEDTEITNFGEHLIRRTVETMFERLEAPPALLCGAHVPGVGLAETLENASVPTPASVAAAIRALARREARRVRDSDVRHIVAGPRLDELLSRDPDAYDFREALAGAYKAR